MTDEYPDLDLDWRIGCAITVTRWWMHSDNPAEELKDWLDEAAEGDEPYMRFALRCFEQTSHLNYVELEERMAMLTRWRDRRHNQKDDIPF